MSSRDMKWQQALTTTQCQVFAQELLAAPQNSAELPKFLIKTAKERRYLPFHLMAMEQLRRSHFPWHEHELAALTRVWGWADQRLKFQIAATCLQAYFQGNGSARRHLVAMEAPDGNPFLQGVYALVRRELHQDRKAWDKLCKDLDSSLFFSWLLDEASTLGWQCSEEDCLRLSQHESQWVRIHLIKHLIARPSLHSLLQNIIGNETCDSVVLGALQACKPDSEGLQTVLTFAQLNERKTVEWQMGLIEFLTQRLNRGLISPILDLDKCSISLPEWVWLKEAFRTKTSQVFCSEVLQQINQLPCQKWVDWQHSPENTQTALFIYSFFGQPLQFKRTPSGWKVYKGEMFGFRWWRLWHELRTPSPSKRQSIAHTTGRHARGTIVLPSCKMAETSPTEVPGEPRVDPRNPLGYGRTPLVDHILSLCLRRQLLVMNPYRTYDLKVKTSVAIKVWLKLTHRFAFYAQLREQDEDQWLELLAQWGIEFGSIGSNPVKAENSMEVVT